MHFVEVWGPPTGLLGVSLQSVFLVVFVGAIPVALLGTLLAVWIHWRGGRWSAAWVRVCHAAVLFQTGSLVSSMLVLWLLLSEVAIADLRRELFGSFGVFLGAVSLNVVGSALGLHSWRALRTMVRETRVRVPSQ